MGVGDGKKQLRGVINSGNRRFSTPKKNRRRVRGCTPSIKPVKERAKQGKINCPHYADGGLADATSWVSKKHGLRETQKKEGGIGRDIYIHLLCKG